MATASCQLTEARINTCSCYHGLKGHLMGAITYSWLQNLPGPNSRWAFLSSAFIRDASSSNSWCWAQKPITDQSSKNKCWWSFSSKWSSYIIPLQGSGKVVEGRKERKKKPEEGKMCCKGFLLEAAQPLHSRALHLCWSAEYPCKLGQVNISSRMRGHKAPLLPRELLAVSGYWKRGVISSEVEPLMSCPCLSQQILTSSQARYPDLSVSLIEDEKIGGGACWGFQWETEGNGREWVRGTWRKFTVYT